MSRHACVSKTHTEHTVPVQQSEFNRLLNLWNPKKTITLSRNCLSHVHSAAHQANNGPGMSLSLQMKHLGSPVQPGARLCKQLCALQAAHKLNKKYNMAWSKQRRAWKRDLAYQRYDANAAEKCYKKEWVLMLGTLNSPP